MALIGKKRCTAIDDTCWETKQVGDVTVIDKYDPGRFVPKNIVFPNNGKTIISKYFMVENNQKCEVDTIDFNNNFIEENPGGTEGLCMTYNTKLAYGFNPDQENFDGVFHGSFIQEYDGLPENAKSMENTFSFSFIMKFPVLGHKVETLKCAFESCDGLVTVLDIPQSVINMDATFRHCSSLMYGARSMGNNIKALRYTYASCPKLVSTGVLPDSVESMLSTFENCGSLKVVNKLPRNLKYMDATFRRCIRLESVGAVPEGVTIMDSAFEHTGLVYAPKLPSTVLSVDNIFKDCKDLKKGADLPERVITAYNAYAHTAIKKAVKMGKSLVDCRYMYEDCRSLKKAEDLPNSVCRADGMFHSSGLERPPKLSKNLEEMEEMFKYCYDLLEFPIIPPNVITVRNAFLGCSKVSGDFIILSPHLNWLSDAPISFHDRLSNLNAIYVPYYNNDVYKSRTRTYQTLLDWMEKYQHFYRVLDVREHPDYDNFIKDYTDD